MGAPAHFTEANFVLGPPAGYEEDVVPLPVRRTSDGRSTSCWVLTPEEKAEIARTGKVWLSVWSGLGHPPVMVTGLKAEVIPLEQMPAGTAEA
jgi:hypothetical protein